MQKLFQLVSPIRENFKTLLHLAGWTVALCTIAAFLGQGLWIFDLLTHFRVHYFLLLTGIATIMFFRTWFRSALICGGFALLNLWVVLPFYATTNADAAPVATTHRAMFLNVLSTNNNLEQVVSYIQEHEPDVVVLAEVTPKWKSAIAELAETFPYAEYRVHHRFQGIALLSRHPLRNARIFRFEEHDMPLVRAELELDGRPLTLIGIHPYSPITPKRSRLRNRQFEALSEVLNRTSGAKLVIGDFNITPWAEPFSDLLESAEMTNTAVGFGFQPTWPAWLPSFGIPIDHCLISPELKTVNHQTGKSLGSDHCSLIIDFSFENL